MPNISESCENYLEAIYDLSKSNELVRSIDIARKIGVSRPSVNKAIGVLKKAGLVEHEQYGSVCFTEKGVKRAEAIQKRHVLIKRFLAEVLGVDEVTSDADACKMEHIVSELTIRKLTEYLENMLEVNDIGDRS